MAELVPVVMGFLAGILICARANTRRRRLPLTVGASIVIGAFASWVTGELARSLVFLAIDIPAAFIGVVVGVLVTDRLRGPVRARLGARLGG